MHKNQCKAFSDLIREGGISSVGESIKSGLCMYSKRSPRPFIPNVLTGGTHRLAPLVPKTWGCLCVISTISNDIIHAP